MQPVVQFAGGMGDEQWCEAAEVLMRVSTVADRDPRNAGVASVAVSYGAHAHDDFGRFAPLFVAHSTRELHDWLHEHA